MVSLIFSAMLSGFVRIRNRRKYLEIETGGQNDVVVNDQKPSSSQIWYIEMLDQDTFIIKPADDLGEAVDIKGGFFTSGTELITYSVTKNSNQKFIYKNGLIKSAGDLNMAITTNDGKNLLKLNNSIMISEARGTEDQIWSMIDASSEYKALTSKN